MGIVGKILADRYEIREEIGKGGMAHVFKAWDNMLNRNVAIKVLKEEFKDDREFVRRFNVEAQAAARISDNHVVSIYDVGFEDGLYYIVMEHIEGVTLKKYISEKGKLPWREAAGYAAQICGGLEAAHKNNVVHRDIKPQNIIITPDGVLKVTDFGIARASNSQATVTTGNNAIGTVHYLSPEQARGGYTDERTDIYSLGVVLYEMLTGRLPFVDESPVAVAIKHIQESPTPVREIDPNIPVGMEQITLRAMKKEKDTRYPQAGDMLKDLNEVLIDPTYVIDGVAENIPDFEGDNDLDSTKKMPRIDDEVIKQYESGRKRKNVRKVDEEIEMREVGISRRENRKKERRVTAIAILTAVLLVAALGTVFAGITGGISLFTSVEKIEIPNLVDMNIEGAQHQYKDSFSIVRQSATPNDKPAGTILEQRPEAGSKVTAKEDMIIYVVISSGKETERLANYTGWKFEDAEKALRDAGYQVNVVKKKDDSQEEGNVFGQDPAPGLSASKGGMVTLFVSEGKEDAKESAEPTATAKPTATATAKPTATVKPTATAGATSNSSSSNGNGGNTTTKPTTGTGTGSGTAATPSAAPVIGD